MEKFYGELNKVTEQDIELLNKNPEMFWEGVTEIAERAFKGCKTLTNITIPNSITKIGYHAFEDCASLTNITLPNSITTIETRTFKGCTSLANITIPSSVTKIEYNAFEGCTGLINIIIPRSVTEIGEYSFDGCTSLTDITIPSSVTKIERCAFYGCTNLTNVVIPNGVTKIGDGVFSNCTSLSHLTVPNSVTEIDTRGFYYIPSVTYKRVTLSGMAWTDEMIKAVECLSDTAKYSKIYKLAQEKGINLDNSQEFLALCVNLGMMEDKSTTISLSKNIHKETKIPVSDVAFTFMQGLINRGDIDLNSLHQNLSDLQLWGYNEAFAKFVMNKTNWSDIAQNMTTLARVYDWFKARTELNLEEVSSDMLPTSEENRFKVLVYETAESGIDRMKWKNPTMKYLLKEFAETKFTGINSIRDRELAEEIGKHNIYSQKHFIKAKEIDAEREEKGVTDILIKKLRQDRITSLDEYRARTNELRDAILQDCAEILSEQTEDVSNVFTYEMLEKSHPANFAMGCYTSCCALLYGAGAGAMRAMIIHPDIQPLVIRDFDNNIVAFGIIYVNREEGYAVVNDFEVNKRYEGKEKQRKAIYEKAMQGVRAFVEEYNAENPNKPIHKVTSGISPNWTAINDFIQQHPQSPILKAPHFNDFKYAGSGSWNGDWHRGQYIIYEEGKNHEL